MGKLTAKQQKFVEAYNGNATEAAISAGYAKNSAEVTGCRLLRNAKIVEQIQARQDKPRSLRILTREERQNFWTRVALGEEGDPDMKDRLKASELLGRSEADFTEVVKHTGKPTVIIKDLSGK